MKRILILCLIFCHLTSMLSACGEEQDSSLSTVPDGSETVVEPSQKMETETLETEKPNDTIEVTVDEAVLYDENGVKVTVSGFDAYGFMGPEIMVLVENSTEKNIALSGSVFVVNGITVNGSAYIEVASGKKSNNVITLYSSELETAGIEEIASVSSVDMQIFDTDSFVTLSSVTLSIETSIADNYVQNLDKSGDIVFQQDGITVIAKNMRKDIVGESIILLAINETGKDIILQAENISVNGFTLDGWMYNIIAKDTSCFCVMELYAESLAKNGIDTVEEVTFTLTAMDNTSYYMISSSDEIKLIATE